MRILLFLSTLLFCLAGCGDQVDAASDKLVVYSGRGAVLVEPIFEKFTAETGIEVELVFGGSTEELANRLATEGAETPADVFFAQDSGYLGALAEAGLLRPLPDDLTTAVAAPYRNDSGRWVAVSGRARVLVYNPDKVDPATLPASLHELADPRWQGRLGWAPSNASFQAHVSALRALWGEDETRAWLERMIALEPIVYPKNSPQVKAVSSGEIDVGWVNHYYLHKLKSSDPGLVAANYHFRAEGDAGNLMMLTGIALTASTRREALGQELIRFLLGETAQSYFASEVFEYPCREGVPLHPGVPSPEGLVRVGQEALADVNPTLQLLRELGLL